MLLKAFLLDREVDHGDPGGDFWLVGGISQLGRQIELERLVVSNISPANIYFPSPGNFFDRLLDNRIKTWIQLFANILQKNRFSVVDGIRHTLQEVLFVDFIHNNVFVHIFEPAVGLNLWVNH